MRINQLGENGLIKFLQQSVKKGNQVKVGIGDDACVLNDGKTVLTTDAYAAGVDFNLSYMSYYDVGCRCTCACLADVVAMAAEPQVLLVALGVLRETDLRQIAALYQGIDFICSKLGCEVAGGDIIALDRLIITLTALGKSSSPRLRSQAAPGDFVCVTGYAGLAETGRLILNRSPSAVRRPPSSKAAVRRHLCPLPRVEVMRKLKRKITGLIDTSDGLATDVRHIAESSGVRIVLYPNLLPIHPTTKDLCKKLKVDPIEFSLKAGEDYELLFTTQESPPSEIDRTPITIIGRVEKGSGVFIEEKGKVPPLKIKGYDHLS